MSELLIEKIKEKSYDFVKMKEVENVHWELVEYNSKSKYFYIFTPLIIFISFALTVLTINPIYGCIGVFSLVPLGYFTLKSNYYDMERFNFDNYEEAKKYKEYLEKVYK